MLSGHYQTTMENRMDTMTAERGRYRRDRPGGEREIQARHTRGREGDTGERDQGERRRYSRERPEKRGVLVV